jgi:hypothetical protein
MAQLLLFFVTHRDSRIVALNEEKVKREWKNKN